MAVVAEKLSAHIPRAFRKRTCSKYDSSMERQAAAAGEVSLCRWLARRYARTRRRVRRPPPAAPHASCAEAQSLAGMAGGGCGMSSVWLQTLAVRHRASRAAASARRRSSSCTGPTRYQQEIMPNSKLVPMTRAGLGAKALTGEIVLRCSARASVVQGGQASLADAAHARGKAAQRQLAAAHLAQRAGVRLGPAACQLSAKCGASSSNLEMALAPQLQAEGNVDRRANSSWLLSAHPRYVTCLHLLAKTRQKARMCCVACSVPFCYGVRQGRGEHDVLGCVRA